VDSASGYVQCTAWYVILPTHSPSSCSWLSESIWKNANVSTLGKTVPAISSPTQRYASPSPYPVQSSPTNSISTSDAEPAIPYSKPSSPYLVLSSSQPQYMIPDAESPFSKSNSMEAAVPPVPSPESLPTNHEVLDPQMFTFNPSHGWHNASYTSNLLTTNSDCVSSRNGWDMEGGQDWGGNGYGAFDP
jgi:hypothetical protein